MVKARPIKPKRRRNGKRSLRDLRFEEFLEDAKLELQAERIRRAGNRLKRCYFSLEDYNAASAFDKAEIEKNFSKVLNRSFAEELAKAQRMSRWKITWNNFVRKFIIR